MRTFEPDKLPDDAPYCGAGGALGVCLALWLTALLAFWLAQDSFAAYWHEHYQRPSPLLQLERFALWRTGAQVHERSLHWREALAVPLRSATPDAAASAPTVDADDASNDEPLLLAMAATQGATAMPHEAALAAEEVALYEPPQPEHTWPTQAADAQQEQARGDAVPLSHQHEVFFAGDSMMEGVAPHLALWFKKRGIRSTNRSRLSTGLTYPNAKTRDWPREIEQALAANARLKLVVMFLGPNDPWDMPAPSARGQFLRYGTPEWEAEYRRRISRILNAAARRGARVIWMGPPPMRRAKLHTQMEYLDEVMRSETAGRAIFISTRALLSSAAGGYAERINVGGRMVGVRAPDGVHFSPAGQRLLARAVQEHIRILPDTAAAPKKLPAQPVQLAAAPLPAPLPHTAPAPKPAPATPAPPTLPALPTINADGTLTLAAHHEAFFAGDSMMQAVAPHIALWLGQQGIRSSNRSRFSTGLTYPNAQTRDWPQEIERALAANKQLKLIVMFLGPNDPLDMPDPAARGKRFLRFASPEWEAEYRSRITRILDAADKHGARLLWIGLPAMRSPRYEHKMAYLDGVIRSATEGRALYLPTRALLSDSDSYTETLLLHGKKTKVRASDGVHFSAAGQRLIADAVQQRIRIASAPATAVTEIAAAAAR